MHILFTAHCFYFMLYRLLFTLSLNIHYRFPLIPLNVTLRLTSLLILQVLQNTCIRTDCNIVILPTSERRKTGGQVETVQVTGYCTRSLGNLFA